MRIGIWMLAASGLTIWAQSTMHDGPVGMENGSVKLTMRTDTLIDRATFGMPLHVMMAHTHQFPHTLLIYNPGKAPAAASLGVNDQIQVGLSDGSVVTIAQRDVSGAGSFVPGHAALIGQKVSREPGMARTVESRLRGTPHNESFHRMWVITAPPSSKWFAFGNGVTDGTISYDVQHTGTPSDHHANAKVARYQLEVNGNKNIFMRTLAVNFAGGKKRVYELTPKSSFVLCENDRVKGVVKSKCAMASVASPAGTTPLPN